jgi:hypothetical protein
MAKKVYDFVYRYIQLKSYEKYIELLRRIGIEIHTPIFLKSFKNMIR